MTDIVPELLEKIKAALDNINARDSEYQDLLKLIQGTVKANHINTQQFAIRLGDNLSKALLDIVTPDTLPDGKLYYNIAERILQNVLGHNSEEVFTYAVAVQQQLNDNLGVGLKPVIPKVNTERIRGIASGAANAETFEKARTYLDEPVKTFTQSCADDFMQTNFDFQGKAGLSPKIVRTYENGCCDWCAKLAGEYEYPVDNTDVYRRHERCRCLVVFESNKHRQNVHTKQTVNATEREERINAEKGLIQNQKVKSETAEMYRRYVAADGHEIIDKPTYNKLTKSFLNNGGIIIRGEVAEAILKERGYASYYRGEKLALIKDDATVSDVLEEMHHAYQDRTNMFGSNDVEDISLKREIETQGYLLANAKKYNIPESELKVTQENLRLYIEEAELKGIDYETYSYSGV